MSSDRHRTEANMLPVREVYCPAHFGNSYEAMWPGEMREYLAELKWMGFNAYGDWMTCTDVCNPYTSDAYWDLAMEQFSRKKEAFRSARGLGMDLDLIITTNHVYLDQLRPRLAAQKSERIFGQLLCPSKPEARRIIHENFEQVFRDLAESGIRLSTLTAFAYDYGGCGCRRCHPWILTFANLVQEVHQVAERWHPGIAPRFCSWWWTREEHELIHRWAAREAKGWLQGMVLHIPYGETCFADLPVPDGCQRLAFVHIGYSDVSEADDIYGKWGPVVAPQRIPQTLADITAAGADGFVAYSEGVFDDVNKMLLARIASGKAKTASTASRQYARRYFRVQGSWAQRWARWIAAWGDRRTVDLEVAARELQALHRHSSDGWRLEHWEAKLRMEELDRAIGPQGPWTRKRLQLVDRYWQEREVLLRHIYRLGPVRHVFAPQFRPPKWYDSWCRVTRAERSRALADEA